MLLRNPRKATVQEPRFCGCGTSSGVLGTLELKPMARLQLSQAAGRAIRIRFGCAVCFNQRTLRLSPRSNGRMRTQVERGIVLCLVQSPDMPLLLEFIAVFSDCWRHRPFPALIKQILEQTSGGPVHPKERLIWQRKPNRMELPHLSFQPIRPLKSCAKPRLDAKHVLCGRVVP